MFSKVKSAVVTGFRTNYIDIETHIAGGLPHYSVVGLPGAAVRESKERVRAALKSSSQLYPDERITQSLIPACEKKEGSQLDLPLAVGIFCAVHQLDTGNLHFLGELSLDGRIKAIPKIANYLLSAPESSVFVLSRECEKEVELHDFSCICLYYETLSELFSDLKRERLSEYLQGKTGGPSGTEEAESGSSEGEFPDFSQVRGQADAIRKLQIAAVGSFHTLIYGPPGCGKTMVAMRFPRLMPCPNRTESAEISRIYGEFPVGGRPIRAPHHSITRSGLIGGGDPIQIGEITKAHNGVLLLDEFGEYPKGMTELLREPLESGHINIARGASSTTLPAKFLLVATMNPCFCGRFSRETLDCSCSTESVKKYYARLSWPLIDRMGIFIRMKKSRYADACSKSTEVLKREVDRAIAFGKMFASAQERYSADFEELAAEVYRKDVITLRSFNMIKRVAESIANFEASEQIEASHLRDAISMNPAECLKSIYQIV